MMISPSGRVPGRAPEPSRDGFIDDGGCGTFRGFSLLCLGFSRNEEYMGEEAESGAPWWAQMPPRRGTGSGRAWVGSGHLAAPLRSPSGSRSPLVYEGLWLLFGPILRIFHM